VSGGSYDYAFRGVERMAYEVLRRGKSSPLRAAFAAHLELVAQAMHDIEWEDSGDGADWETSVRAVLAPGAELAAAIEAAERARADLDTVIGAAKAVKP
jgi:hypothetical protein